MPEEEESLGAPGVLAQLLKIVPPPDPAVDPAEPPRYVANGRVVGHYVLSVARRRLDQHHVCRPTELVVANHVVGRAHQCVDRIASRHVQHQDHRIEHGR